ncbi:MAG: hypothetical protein M1833_004827 [Piccolia ochrophora]|nr:MAG: hypothetical protein M1833_004827 [Piccolia ochrophora]
MPAKEMDGTTEETQPLTGPSEFESRRSSLDSASSVSSVSTTSIILERLTKTSQSRNGNATSTPSGVKSSPKRQPILSNQRDRPGAAGEKSLDLEDAPYVESLNRPMGRRVRRIVWMLAVLCLAGWALALVMFLSKGSYRHSSATPHDPSATASRGSGKKVTLDEVQGGDWRPKKQEISWIEGPDGEDGLLLERGSNARQGYLVVEDIRGKSGETADNAHDTKVLMKEGGFQVGGEYVTPVEVWPSKNMKKVLVLSNRKSNWRHSFYGNYWIFDTLRQDAEPLESKDATSLVQLASWSPDSSAIAFTKDKNMYLRKLSSPDVVQITRDGGPDLFYGVPDWVYEEEVFEGNSATWWAEDGKFIAFLRTNESLVPNYPVQYFLSRPTGKEPLPAQENYPDVKRIKYPKAGAPNPTVDLQFYDVEQDETFSVDVEGGFAADDRLITEVVWAGASGKVLVKETNRVSNILQVVLIDVKKRQGKVVRRVDVSALDGGWFEVTERTRYIPADAVNSRPHDGYIDTIIHEGFDHLAYFSPMDSSEPKLLTSGPWEVVDAPSAVDLSTNTVYFIAAKEAPIQRHIYSVTLDGSDLRSISDTSKEGYYGVSISKGAGYALLSYNGPNVPWQEVINTPSNKLSYKHVLETNEHLKELAAKHEMPIESFSTVTIDGFILQVHERRPPHFNPKKQYPVLFQLYGGPGSQTVKKEWHVDFQSVVAANLGYIVVTVDGRGTGYIGREARCIIRGNIGFYEARDQIETAKIWAKKPYVDRDRIAIWGWSYGGFLTLKTLETDGGQTFKYGMAVAPVTDWRFYGITEPLPTARETFLTECLDSVYTERYMDTPQHNPDGYDNASITNTTALGSNVRFLVMHGASDDNVHLQNTLTLLDKLDLEGVENYDVHFFPDSDHSILFHNANRMVYDRKQTRRSRGKRGRLVLTNVGHDLGLSNWLINAFNGEWLEVNNAVPKAQAGATVRSR